MNICVSKNTNQEGFLSVLQTNIAFASWTKNLEEANSQIVDKELLLLDVSELSSDELIK